MPFELNILAFDQNGFKVSGKATGDNLEDATAQFELLNTYTKVANWQPDGMSAAAVKTFGGTPAPTTYVQAPMTSPYTGAPTLSGPSCIHDGTPLEDMTVSGKYFSPSDIAAGRTKKLKEMGVNPAGPECDDCWKKLGHSEQWKKFYASKR